MTQQNAALAEESSASASVLYQQITQLNTLVDQYQTSAGNQSRAASGRPVSGNEPNRLRQMAESAFKGTSGSAAATPRPAAPKPLAKPATARARAANGGWTEM
jgi:hypothetical protein